MIRGIDVNQRIEFVSQYDTDEPKTVFVFRPLTAEGMLEFAGDIANGKLTLAGPQVFKFLEMAIVEVRNFEGASIPEMIRSLPPLVVAELVGEAGKINKLTETDQKN